MIKQSNKYMFPSEFQSYLVFEDGVEIQIYAQINFNEIAIV